MPEWRGEVRWGGVGGMCTTGWNLSLCLTKQSVSTHTPWPSSRRLWSMGRMLSTARPYADAPCSHERLTHCEGAAGWSCYSCFSSYAALYCTKGVCSSNLHVHPRNRAPRRFLMRRRYIGDKKNACLKSCHTFTVNKSGHVETVTIQMCLLQIICLSSVIFCQPHVAANSKWYFFIKCSLLSIFFSWFIENKKNMRKICIYLFIFNEERTKH